MLARLMHRFQKAQQGTIRSSDTGKLVQIWRFSGELLCKLDKAEFVPCLKRRLPNLMLLEMMELAKADRPFVGGFQPQAPVRPGSYVGAFDRQSSAARHRTAVAPDPRPVRSAGARRGLAWLKG